ncbi:MAG: ChbG/HpnK family deacetylase [Nitrospira sp. CR1.1]|nr:ChbG/HpnK family deacetylase [Nitrospira sp. CR1.1]
MRVIINSDDLGISPVVNEKILDLMSRRRITSASILANGPSVEQAIKFIPRGTDCSLGVHLNLTEFKPLTPAKHLNGLRGCLDENGAFAGQQNLSRLSISPTCQEGIYRELKLQVEKVVSLGVKVSHLDSHNHIHTAPQIFLVLKRLQKEFGIRRVRTTWNIYPPGKSVSKALLIKKKVWDFALRRFYATTTTEGLTTFSTFYNLAKTRKLLCHSIELMTHPGHAEYDEETRLLERDWENEIVFPVDLISYHAL